jgi:Second Messenger Oligonucleotide or Dinucleotide Synthetase domain
MEVSARFTSFLSNLKLTYSQRVDGSTKHKGVRTCLNRHYYNSSSDSDNSLLAGSWGKSTEIRPPRDIDVLFGLPKSVYDQYESRIGNKQSQLLQEVKSVLAATYSTTKMRGDGQVIVVPFESYAVELVPAFLLTDGKYWICNTPDGGSYKTVDPKAEKSHIKVSNDDTKGNTRDLIRMMKCWQDYCNVPLKSFVIELLVVQFIAGWAHKGKSTVYYDWMVRDFLNYLKGKYSWESVSVPGILETISLGDSWKSRAETAYSRAAKACEYEAAKKPDEAGSEWQKIFGSLIPIR